MTQLLQRFFPKGKFLHLPQTQITLRGNLKGYAATHRSSPADSPLAAVVMNHGLNYPTPANLSYFWNFGSLSALCLGLQLFSGIFLAMHYTAALSLAFDSVEHIMRDVSGG